MISSNNKSSSSASSNANRLKCRKDKGEENGASTLYLDFSIQSTAAKRTSDTLTASTSTGSLRSLSSAKNLISLSLLQEKEHAEKESANRSSRNVGSALRRSPSRRKRNLANSSSIGLRLSDLAALSASSQCEDSDDDDDESRGSNAAFDDSRSSVMSGSTIFHKIANRVKIASLSSTNNLAAITESSNEIETQQHGSNYFKNRMSIRVRRASDLLFSSHHRKGLEDVEEDEHYDNQL